MRILVNPMMLMHKVNGPAYIDDNDSSIWAWWLNGQRHRYYGPQNYTNAWCIHHLRIK
jgi:hypothetical protein